MGARGILDARRDFEVGSANAQEVLRKGVEMAAAHSAEKIRRESATHLSTLKMAGFEAPFAGWL